MLGNPFPLQTSYARDPESESAVDSLRDSSSSFPIYLRSLARSLALSLIPFSLALFITSAAEPPQVFLYRQWDHRKERRRLLYFISWKGLKYCKGCTLCIWLSKLHLSSVYSMSQDSFVQRVLADYSTSAKHCELEILC